MASDPNSFVRPEDRYRVVEIVDLGPEEEDTNYSQEDSVVGLRRTTSFRRAIEFNNSLDETVPLPPATLSPIIVPECIFSPSPHRKSALASIPEVSLPPPSSLHD